MPSQLHEVLVTLFRERPELAAELLTGALGMRLPEYREARLEPSDATDLAPTEYRADAVVVLSDGGRPVLAVVVEIQLSRDPTKAWSWPVYLATLRARLRAPTALLVLCPDRGVARWCSTEIEMGHPGWVLRPLVVGPDVVPIVVDPLEACRSPELAVLSVMAHGDHGNLDQALDALMKGLEKLDDDRARLYADVALAALPAAARARLEELMSIGTYEYQSGFARRYYGQGKVEGEAEAVLKVLAARGVTVPDEARARIAGCTDLDELDTWLTRAVSISTIDELFA